MVDPAFDTLTFDTLFLDLQNRGRPPFGEWGWGPVVLAGHRARSELIWGSAFASAPSLSALTCQLSVTRGESVRGWLGACGALGEGSTDGYVSHGASPFGENQGTVT